MKECTVYHNNKSNGYKALIFVFEEETKDHEQFAVLGGPSGCTLYPVSVLGESPFTGPIDALFDIDDVLGILGFSKDEAKFVEEPEVEARVMEAAAYHEPKGDMIAVWYS